MERVLDWNSENLHYLVLVLTLSKSLEVSRPSCSHLPQENLALGKSHKILDKDEVWSFNLYSRLSQVKMMLLVFNHFDLQKNGNSVCFNISRIKLEEAMETYSSVLAWRFPMDRGAWHDIVHGVARSQTWPSKLSTAQNSTGLSWPTRQEQPRGSISPHLTVTVCFMFSSYK